VTYIGPDGKRVSTEAAYLTKDVLKRPNLTVAVKCRVTKILFDTSLDVKRATGVEFVTDQAGPRYRVFAKKEVILS
jgi:choline dehydrogenase